MSKDKGENLILAEGSLPEQEAYQDLVNKRVAILGSSKKVRLLNSAEMNFHPYDVKASEAHFKIEEMGELAFLVVRDKGEDATLIAVNGDSLDIAMADGVSNCAFPKRAAVLACWTGRKITNILGRFQEVFDTMLRVDISEVLRKEVPPDESGESYSLKATRLLDKARDFIAQDAIFRTTLALCFYNSDKKEAQVGILGDTTIAVFHSDGSHNFLTDSENNQLAYGTELDKSKITRGVITITEGDILVVFTDGLLGRLDFEELSKIVSEARERNLDVGNAITTRVKRAISENNGEPGDDISLVVFQPVF